MLVAYVVLLIDRKKFSLIPFLHFILSFQSVPVLIFLSCNPLFCPLPFSCLQAWTNVLQLCNKSIGTHLGLTNLDTFSNFCNKFLF